MSDYKISELTELAQGNVADTDEAVIVDKSDTTHAASGTTKRWTWASIKADILAYIDDATATLTNKTINLTSNTLVTTKAQLDSAVSDGNVLYVGDVTTNATHTGEVTGSGALTVDKTAITNRTLVTAAVGDHIMVADASDSDNLKKVTVQTIVDLASGLSDGDKGDITVSGSGTVWNIDAATIGITEMSASGTPSATTFLRGDNTWSVPAGSGDVSKVGTPANDQMAVWTGDGTLEGTSDFTYDGTSLNLITGKNLQIAGATVLADAAGTTTLSNIDAIDATTEATIESALDTLPNVTSIQGRTVTLADAGVNAIFGWDDTAGAYENLTQGEVRAVAGLATTDSPEFAGVNVGHASDTTISRSAAGQIAVEGVQVVTTSNTVTMTNKTLQHTFEPASDDTFTGETLQGLNAGATIAQWDCVYLGSASKWLLTDADAASSAGGVMVAMATSSGTDTNPLTVILRGVVRNDGWTWATVGAPLYLDTTTAGGMTLTAPSGTDDVVKVVGYVLSDDCIYFNPSNDWITRV